MRPVVAAAAAIPVLACTALAAPAEAAPQPNEVTFVCGGTSYTGTAGSQMAVSAHFRSAQGPGVGIVKDAEGLPAFNGVPRRLLTECQVLLNGEPAFTEFGPLYVLLVGPGAQPAA